jgi:hypothetical protein
MFCNYCAAPNPNDASFCRACGKAIGASAPQPPVKEASPQEIAQSPGMTWDGRPRRKTHTGLFVVAAAVLGGALVLVLVVQHRREADAREAKSRAEWDAAHRTAAIWGEALTHPMDAFNGTLHKASESANTAATKPPCESMPSGCNSANTPPSSSPPAPTVSMPPPLLPAADAAASNSQLKQAESYSQARYITASQFLEAVKEVSLDLQTVPTLGKYISVSEQRSSIGSALAGYGIAVRPGAPVTLQVNVVHNVNVLTVYEKDTDPANGEKHPIHEIEVALQFFVKAGAWRNGRLHVVAAAPAHVTFAADVIEQDSSGKFLLGDVTTQKIKHAFNDNLANSLKSIASDTKAETTSWIVNSWTAKDKEAADAEFARLMNAQSPIDKHQLDGIDSVPELILAPWNNHNLCKAPDSSAWRDAWNKAFQRVGWTSKPLQPTLLLKHDFRCFFNYGFFALHYFWYSDVIILVENNLVFELNGALVRRPGELLYESHSTDSVENETKAPTQDFIPRSISDFLVDLSTGIGNIPALSAAPAPRHP